MSTTHTRLLDGAPVRHLQRQGTLTEQLFDVLCAANAAGYRDAAAFIHHRVFTPHIAVTYDEQAARRQLHEIRPIAVTLGCYDAAEWITRQPCP